MQKTKWIWKNGEWIEWENATTHILTHALHYGTGVFEGVRAYETDKGPAIFRANEHYARLKDSAKIYEMAYDYSSEQLIEITRQLIERNELASCYIRPIVYRGYGEMGLNPLKSPVDVAIAAWSWGTYLGEEGLEKGIRCKMSSWARLDSRILPLMAKATANYANSALAKMEAISCGYDEAILLNVNGLVAEGPGENIFVVKNGVIYTPLFSDGALAGITADAVMRLARDLGHEVVQRNMIRDELFLADELFFTGTAAEVTPIREIDGRVIGQGKRGPVTARIQTLFFDVVKGKNSQYKEWLTHTR